MSTNSCVLIGNLVRDPELSPVGKSKVCRFALAVNDGYGDNQRTYFIECEAWNKVAETISSYCAKGNRVAVTGQVAQSSWKTDDGTRSKTYVKVFSVDFLFNAKEKSGSSLSKGDRVYTTEYGPDYPATVSQVGKNQVKVEYDDGDKGVYDFADVVVITEDEEPAPF
jgi:single-strand DNA-binding protein